MQIINSDKLSLLLYQNSLDMTRMSFKDLLVRERDQLRGKIVAALDGGQMPILATLKGAYDAKIRVAIYVSALPQPDGKAGRVDVGTCKLTDKN